MSTDARRRLTTAACLAAIALFSFAAPPAWSATERDPSELPYTIDVSLARTTGEPGAYLARVEFRDRSTGRLAKALLLVLHPGEVTESRTPPLTPLIARARIELSADGTSATYSAELREEGIALVAARTGTVSLPSS